MKNERLVEFSPKPERIAQKKRVMVLLGARMYQGKENVVFPLTLSEDQKPKESIVERTSGGFSRMRAIQKEIEEMKGKNETLTIVTGGEEKDIGSRADEAAKILVSHYGLPPESVVSVGGEGNTRGNAAATIEYISKHKEQLGDVDRVEIVTNDYHMLRAWTIFSKEILESSGKKLEVSQEDKEKIKKCLDAEFLGEWDPRHTKETRNTVMEILKPYFAESKTKITPLVVEEVLESSREKSDIAKSRYAKRLRDTSIIPEVVRSEYQGLMYLLEISKPN